MSNDAVYFPKMYWCHRIVRADGLLRFAEVSYDENNKLLGYSDPFMCGEDIKELSMLVQQLQDALAQPVLDESDFPNDLPEEVK